MGSPGSRPPTPRSPRRSSACPRQGLRSITHDGSASVPESRPASRRGDARAGAGPQPAVPAVPAQSRTARLLPGWGALPRGGSGAARPALHTGRVLGPVAAAATPPPLQVLRRTGPGCVQRGSTGAGSSQGISKSFALLAYSATRGWTLPARMMRWLSGGRGPEQWTSTYEWISAVEVCSVLPFLFSRERSQFPHCLLP